LAMRMVADVTETRNVISSLEFKTCMTLKSLKFLHLMLFPTLGPSSLPVLVAQPDERHANRAASVLKWYDRHKA